MKIGILTSGGDSPGMNAAVRSAVRSAIHEGFEAYGIYRGYEGLIDGDIKKLDVSSVADILHRGGTMLRTARSERFRTEEGQRKAASVLDTFGIDSLIVIGGDGSMRGGLDLTKYGIRVMVLPGTIDNDLAYTDYTIGFDTAINTVLSAISNIRDTSSAHERTTVIEVMGRSSGSIALYAGLAGGAESILVPEETFDLSAVCRKIIEGRNRGKLHNIIIKAEGVEIGTEELAREIEARTGFEARIVVLSYLQRGGSPTAQDRLLASLTAAKAVELIAEGSESRAVGMVNGLIVSYPLEEAIRLQGSKEYDRRFMELADVLS